MTYQLGSLSWTQDFDAVDVDDALLSAAAERSALTVEGPINETATWIKLRHQKAPQEERARSFESCPR